MAAILFIGCVVLGFFVAASRNTSEENTSPVIVIQTERRPSAGQLWRMFVLGFLAALMVVLWIATSR